MQDRVLFFKEKIYLEEDLALIHIIEQFHNSTHEGFERLSSEFVQISIRKEHEIE